MSHQEVVKMIKCEFSSCVSSRNERYGLKIYITMISGIYCNNDINDDNSENRMHPLRDKNKYYLCYFYPGALNISACTCNVMTV